jgi:hypothetical protein
MGLRRDLCVIGPTCSSEGSTKGGLKWLIRERLPKKPG